MCGWIADGVSWSAKRVRTIDANAVGSSFMSRVRIPALAAGFAVAHAPAARTAVE
jgi:hypothetical protein